MESTNPCRELVDIMDAEKRVRVEEMTRQILEHEQDVTDAKRWRALTGAGRLRYLGSAGFDHDSDKRSEVTVATARQTGGLHFGMEVWDKYGEAADYPTLPRENAHAVSVLKAFADELIRRAAL